MIRSRNGRPRAAEAGMWAVLGVVLLVPATPAAGQVDDDDPAADPAPDTAPDDDVEAEEEGSGRLTWGVVPSGVDGPTGRSRFELEVEPGETLVDYVGVINYTLEEQTFDVYGQDAFTTSEGGFDILPAADTSSGAGTWVSLDVDEVTIPPRSRVDVPFRLEVPSNATPGDHAAGIVASSTSTQLDTDGSRVAVDRRVGARVYLRVAGDLEPRLTVEQLDVSYDHRLNPFGRGTATFDYRVTNTGNVRLAGDPTSGTRWLFGWLSREAAGERLPELLPGESFVASAEIDRVVPLVWQYADLQVEPIPPDSPAMDVPVVMASATTIVWTIPWSLFALVLAFAAIAGYRRRRRRSRAASDGGGDGGREDAGDAGAATPGASGEERGGTEASKGTNRDAGSASR